MDDATEHKITEFRSQTNTSDSVAKQYLERSNGNLSSAIADYRASQSEHRLRSSAGSPSHSTLSASSSSPHGLPSKAKRSEAHSSSRTRGGIMTFKDFENGRTANDDDDKSEFFAGGKNSGISIQGPDQNAEENPASFIRQILEKARRQAQEFAATGASQESEEPSSSHNQRFQGQGYSLGTGRVVEGEPEVPDTNGQLPKVKRHLTFWKDGLSFDDENLLRYDDPANERILANINRGQAPLHLLNVEPGQEVDVHVEQRRDENFKKTWKPFSGHGNRLGATRDMLPVGGVTVSPSSQANQDSNFTADATAPTVDSSEESMEIQIRLSDGRLDRVKLNNSATVQQLYDHVQNRYSLSSGFMLQFDFPPQKLTEKSITLEKAGLKNALVAVVQERL